MSGVFRFCPICKQSLSESRIEGRVKLVCSKCSWVDYKNPVPVVVCVAINNKSQIFIAKRNFAPGINRWALPGGFIEANEIPEKACLRELKEETGLEGKAAELVGVYIRKAKKYGNLLVIGYRVNVMHENIYVNEEIRDGRFVEYSKLPHIPFLTHRKIIAEVFKKI